MSVSPPQPTRYQDVNNALNLLLSHQQAILSEQFVGLYLGGSLALGDFTPHRSDIDFVAVTVDESSPGMVAALEEMHTVLWATGPIWARKLDGSYVPQQVFRHWSAPHPPCPFVEGNSFTITQQGSAVIQRHIIHQYGVVVAGPSPYILRRYSDSHRTRNARIIFGHPIPIRMGRSESISVRYVAEIALFFRGWSR